MNRVMGTVQRFLSDSGRAVAFLRAIPVGAEWRLGGIAQICYEIFAGFSDSRGSAERGVARRVRGRG